LVAAGLAWIGGGQAMGQELQPPVGVDVEQRLQQLEAELAALRAQQTGLAPIQMMGAEAAGAQAPGLVPPAPSPGATGPGESLATAAIPAASPSTAPSGPLYQIFGPPAADDEFPSVIVSGFFHLDTGFYNQNAANKRTVGNLQNGTGFRRARLLARGNLTQDVTYQMEFDFALSQPLFTDLWMDFANVGNFMNVRIGRFRQPFGMTELTSIRELWFIERPLLFALSPFRQTGIMGYGTNEDQTITWAGSVYQYASDNFGNVLGDNGGWGGAMRVTGLLYDDPTTNTLIHLGGDYSLNDPARDRVRYLNVPEFFMGQTQNQFAPGIVGSGPIVANPPFVDTGLVPTNMTNLFNLEAAAATGDLYVQSEFRWAVQDQINGPTNTFPGAYVMSRYVLTGEKIPYNRKGGVFGRVVPNDPVHFGAGGMGAWELTARWSWLDLNGTNIPGPGRNLNDLTFGMNWYLNGFTKFQFNYIHAFLDDPQLGGSDADIYALRGQIDF
jgi:phosphate-selective porin OprO/OprP